MGIVLSLSPVAADTAAPSDAAPRTVRVGVLLDNYPFSYAGKDGLPEGFAVDLLAEVERVMALKLERRTGTAREINGAFEQGHIDLLQSYSRSSDREAFADFSQPYVKMGGSIFVRKGEKRIKSLADLRGRRVMVHPGSQGEQVLRDAGLSESVVHVESVEEALRLLNQGSNDATLLSRLTGLTMARQYEFDNVTPVGDPVYEVEYCFAARKEHSDVLMRIDEGMLIIQRPGGPYQRIYRKWFSQLGGYSRRDIIRAVAAGLGVALLVAIWAWWRQRSLHVRLRHKAAALRASEERYRSVFEASADAMLVLIPCEPAQRDFRIEQANPAATRLLDPKTTTGTNTLLSLALPEGSSLAERVQAALHSGAPHAFEHQTGSVTDAQWFRASVSTFDSRVLLILADITEPKLAEIRLKQQERHLRQQQKLESIGTMASGIAHDFNNILTGIIGNAELARLTLPPEHAALRSLDEILGGSERAKQLVRRILTFSRQNEGRTEIVNLGLLIQESLDFIRASVPLLVRVEYAQPPVTCEVQGDPTQLNQVLLNLLTNAFYAIGENRGTVEVSLQSLHISEEQADLESRLPAGSYAQITVKDTGCGMSPDLQQRIFDPFFTTKPHSQGTGLGLSVAHGIVKQHKGDISVYSRPGQGSAFHVLLPLHAPPRPNARPAPQTVHQPLVHGNGEHVLVIDDDPAVIRTCQLALERLGYRVTAFTDALAAVEAFTRRPGTFDVIVCDLTMPSLGGLQVAERIGPGCPFILISGYLSEKDRMEARARGITRVLDKPIHLNELARCLAESLKPYRP